MRTCRRCGDSGYAYACPTCRRNARYRARGLPLGNCCGCGLLTWVGTWRLCRLCLRAQALKVCPRCSLVLPRGLSFWARHRLCKACERDRRHAVPANVYRDIGGRRRKIGTAWLRFP